MKYRQCSRPEWSALALVLFLGSLGCGSTRERENLSEVKADVASTPDRYAQKPWTGAFAQRSVLLADEVRVEGPQGLLDHLYFDGSATHEQKARTVPEGFLQSVLVRPGSSERIRAQLDGMRIDAIRSLTVLERIEPCDVRVIAIGEVFWRSVDGAEVRQESWEMVGKIGE